MVSTSGFKLSSCTRRVKSAFSSRDFKKVCLRIAGIAIDNTAINNGGFSSLA